MLDAALGRLLAANNDRVRRAEGELANPRRLGDVAWHGEVAAAFPAVRTEWDAFEAAGGRLPRLSDLVAEDQGNTETWSAGLLWSSGRAVDPLAGMFPSTTAALCRVVGLRSALFSVLSPGAELPPHAGPNAGVLRYHLGISCVGDTALRVGDVIVPYRDGEAVLFDDTVEHEAWNRSDTRRVTLFLELLRPLTGSADLLNRGVQRLLMLDPRYRAAPERAAEWHAALNHLP